MVGHTSRRDFINVDKLEVAFLNGVRRSPDEIDLLNEVMDWVCGNESAMRRKQTFGAA